MAAFHHFTDRAPNHDAVERLRQGIAFDIVHAAAHIGVKAEVFVFDQHLLIGQRWGVEREQLKILGQGLAFGATDQMDLRVLRHVCLRGK